MEDRRPQFVEALRQSEGLTAARASKALDESIDRLVWYAGWADKITQVVGNANPVAGPFFNLSTPEPTGVVAVVAPEESSLLGLVSVVAPVIVTGNTAVVMSSYSRPLPAITFSEVLATSDVPGGVVNILTGNPADTAPWLAAHMDVNAIDLTGIAGDAETRHLPRGGRGRQPQAGTPGPGRRAGLVRRPRPRPDDLLPGDQDRLAPDRRLTPAPRPVGGLDTLAALAARPTELCGLGVVSTRSLRSRLDQLTTARPTELGSSPVGRAGRAPASPCETPGPQASGRRVSGGAGEGMLHACTSTPAAVRSGWQHATNADAEVRRRPRPDRGRGRARHGRPRRHAVSDAASDMRGVLEVVSAVIAEHGTNVEACIADFQATDGQSAGEFHGLAR